MAYEDDEYEDESYDESTSSEETFEPWTPPEEPPPPPPPPEPEPEAAAPEPEPKQYASVDTGVKSDATAAPEEEIFEPWTPPKPEPQPEFGLSDMGVATDARVNLPPPEDKEEKFYPWVPPDESAMTAFAREMGHGVGPAAGGAISGAAVGGGLGAAGFNPITVLGGTLVGAGLGGYGVEAMQEKGLRAFGAPDDAAIRAANEQAHPWSTYGGKALSNVAGGAAGIGKAAVSTGARLLGGGIGAAWEAGVQLYHGKTLKEAAPAIASSAVGGTVFAGDRPWTRAAGAVGAKAGAAARPYLPTTGYRQPPPPEPPPPPVTQPGVKNEDWTGPPQDVPAAPPPAQTEMPWGAQQQPGLPLETPPPGTRKQPPGPEFAPPTVDAEGQLGFNIAAPHGVIPPIDAEGQYGLNITAPHSRQAMPAGAGTSREMPPPSTTRQQMEAQPYSTEAQGRAAHTAGVPAQQAAGINVLQPGQVDPTLAATRTAGLTQRESGPYGPEHPPQPPPGPPRTSFEPPRAPVPPAHDRPITPIPRNQQVAIRTPETTQGVTEPPVRQGQVRLYKGDPRSPTAFTTDRAAAERYGPLRHVDVGQAQLQQQFRPGREPGSLVAHPTLERAYNRRLQPTRPMRTQPTQRRPPPPPAGGQPPGPPPPPTRGGQGAGGGRPPEPRMSSRPLDEQINAAVGRAVWHPEPPAAPARAAAPAPAPGPARPGAGAARYSREQANSMLNQPAKLNAEAARRGMPPDALKQELKDLDTAAREAAFSAAPPQRDVPKAPEKKSPAATPVDKTGTPAAASKAPEPLEELTPKRLTELLGVPKELNNEAARRGMKPNALKQALEKELNQRRKADDVASQQRADEVGLQRDPPWAQPDPPVDISVKGARERAAAASQEKAAPKVAKRAKAGERQDEVGAEAQKEMPKGGTPERIDYEAARRRDREIAEARNELTIEEWAEAGGVKGSRNAKASEYVYLKDKLEKEGKQSDKERTRMWKLHSELSDEARKERVARYMENEEYRKLHADMKKDIHGWNRMDEIAEDINQAFYAARSRAGYEGGAEPAKAEPSAAKLGPGKPNEGWEVDGSKPGDLTHDFEYQGKKGRVTVNVSDDGKTLEVVWIGTGPKGTGPAHELGPRGVIALRSALMEAYPGTTKIVGERISGARAQAGKEDLNAEVKVRPAEPEPAEKPPASSVPIKGPHIDKLQAEFDKVKKEYDQANRAQKKGGITRKQFSEIINRLNAAQDKLFDARWRGMHEPAEPPAAKAAKAVRAAKPKPASDEPRSLLKHIQKLGGIMPDDKGELAAAFGGRKSGLYLQLARSKEKGGLPLDRIVENIARGAPEERYLHEGADINDLLRALKGSREHFPMGEVPKETPVQAERVAAENAAHAERVADSEKKVDDFLKDPDYDLPDAMDVRDRMVEIMEEGRFKNPVDAYEQAIKERDAQRDFEGDVGEPKELADIPDDVGKGRLPAEEPTPKPAAEKGADNKPQEVMFAKDEKTAAQRAADASLKPKTAQKGSDFGMFADRQDDLMDMLSKPKDEPRDTLREFQSMSEAALKGLGRDASGGMTNEQALERAIANSAKRQPQEILPERGTKIPQRQVEPIKESKTYTPSQDLRETKVVGTPEQQQKAAGDKFSSELHKAEQAAEAAGKSKDDYIEFLSPEGKAALKEHTRLAEQNEEVAFNKNYEKLNDMLPEGFTATREKYIRLLGDDDWKAIEGDRHDRSFDIRDKNGEMVGSVDGVHLFDKDTKGGWFKELLDTGSAKPVHEKAMEAAREANNLPKGVVDLGFEKARPGLQKLADNLAAAGKKVPGKVAPFKSVADDAAARISEQNAKAKTAEVNRLQQKYFDAQKQLDSLEKDVKRGTLEDTDPKYLNARRAAEDAINAWHEAEGISIGKKKPEPLRSQVLERGRSGRPIRTTPLAIGSEDAILKAGYEKATGPKGEPREPSRQAAQREGPPGKVKAFDDDGKQTVFTGKTVAEAAAAAKRAGHRDYQIYNTDMTKYRPPARAVAGHNNPPKTATATAAPPAGGGKPPPAGATPPAGGATPPPKGPAAAAAPPRKGRTADEEAILGRVANPESWTDKLPRTKEEANKAWRAYYTAAKNALDPIEQLTKLAGKAPKNPDKVEQFKQDIGWSPKARAVDFEKDPGVLARLTKGLGGRFQSQIGIRNPLTGKVTGGTYDINTGQRTGDPLEKVLTQVRQDPEGFAAYIIARRAVDLHGQGKQTGMDPKAANGVVTAGGARWGPVSKELSAFKDRVLDNLTDVLGAKAVAAIKANNPNHIPFYRAIPPESELGKMVGAGLQTTKPIHEFKGSNEKIYHPLDTIPKNVMAFTDIAERNRVGRALEDLNASLPADRKFMTEVRDNHPIKVSPEEVNRLLKKEGIPEEVIDGMTIFRPDFFKPTDTRIRIFHDGKAKVYEVSPEVGKAWNAMNQQDLHPIIKALSIPARTLRAGAVTNLEFILRNLTRDQITAAMQSPHGYIPYVDFAKGLGNIFVGSEKYHNWLRHGGANANLVSVDRRIINVDPKTLGEKAKNVITSPFHALQLMSELVENATRLGVAMRAKGKGASWTEATFQSREATLDFQRVGANMRAVNNLVAFFNARYEGVDRLARAFRDQPARAAFVALASVTVPSLALWYNNKDDPRVKEIERWEKDIYWLIPTTNWKTITPAVKDYADGLSSAWKRTLPNGTEQYNAGTIYRWPKPFAEGTFFGSIPERVLDAYYDHDPKAFEDLTKVVKKALNLEVSAITPQVAIPFIEQFANESLYFERPLMSEKLAKGSPEKQVNYSTSETAKYIGAAIRAAAGEKASGGSPIIVDNYIRAWTGGLGQYVVRGLSDNIIKAGEEAATGKKRPPAPDSAAADFTGVKAFVSRWPRSQTESIRQFYKERENRMMEKTDYDAMKKSDPDAADIRANQGGLSTGNSTAKILGAARKLVDEINNDKSMSPADKRMAIDLTWLTMIETAKEGLATFKEDKRDRNAK